MTMLFSGCRRLTAAQRLSMSSICVSRETTASRCSLDSREVITSGISLSLVIGLWAKLVTHRV